MAASIAVVGIDVGTQSVVIGQCRRGGVDIILNEASKRLTPSLVSFNGSERMLGEAAVTQVRTNMTNTITEIKRYIGRAYSEAGVQDELSENANFEYVDLGNDELGVEVSYGGDSARFSMTQIYSMLLTKARQVVEFNNPGVKTVEAVITVPGYYTHAQRKAVLDAAAIANVVCLRVLNEGTSAALSYGIFKAAKKEFPEGRETPILFLDMGASACTATVAAFTNTSVKVLSSVSDSSLGGRDFDTAIGKYFAGEFKAKYGSDPWKSKKARIKLLLAAEKAKVSISPHGVNSAPLSVECLYEDRDLSGNLTEDKLVELMGAQVEAKLGGVIRRAMEMAGMRGAQDVASVELVGGGMRPRLVKRVAARVLGMAMDEATGHGLSQSMNLDETIARGAALACAALSTTFKVKPYDIIDTVTFPVKLSYDVPAQAAGAADAAGDAMEDVGEDAAAGAAAAGGEGSMHIFKAGDKVPGAGLMRRVTFKQSGSFEVGLAYDVPADLAFMFPPGKAPSLGRFTVTVPAEAVTPLGAPKVRLNVEYDRNGLVSVVSAEAMKPIEDAPAAGTPSGSASEPAASPSGDVDMAAAAAAAAAGAGAAAAEGAAEAPKKRRFKRLDAQVGPAPGSTSLLFGMSAEARRAAIAAEQRMQATDAEIRATQDMRNSLEAYIYNARSAVGDALGPYTTEAERGGVESALGDMEGWLYGDGFEADKGTYEGKLKQLKALCEPLFGRKWEAENRYSAVEALREAIQKYRDVGANVAGQHGHLNDSDRDTIRAATAEAEAWLKGKHDEQAKREMFQEPAVRVAEVNDRKERLVRELNPIATKKAPPPPAAAPAPAPQAAPAQPEAQPAPGGAPEAGAGAAPAAGDANMA